MEELANPHPPGSYPVVVVGSGPGGLQLSYSLKRLGIQHALISADPGPGGMFRRWPLMQRLLSWTKPFATAEQRSRDFERYDWNSLIADEPENRGLQVEHMDGTSSFPSRPEMEAGLTDFAERTATLARYGCRWESSAREGKDIILQTSDGPYRSRIIVFAVGVAAPWRPSTPGLHQVPHYGEMGSVEQYRGRDVFIVGKKNSAFEISNGLLPWARSIILASPSPARLFIETHSLAGVRARYSQPFEDDLVAGAVNVLSVAVDEVSREGDHYRIHMHGAEDARELVVTADDVICATGFETPLLDLPQMGVETVGQSRLPVMTPYWESVSSPGLHFAGTISQGAVGLKKHGVPSNSGAVQGHRYNARVLARHLAEVHFDAATDDLVVGPEEVVDLALREAHHAPELWHQKAYLARVLEARDGGMADRGVRPLAAFVDESGPDAVAVTLEANARGEIYPVVYTRRANRLEEHVLPGHLLHDFETEEHRLALSSALRPLLGAAVASH